MSHATKVYVTKSGEEIFGVMAEFKNPADLYHAAEKTRDAGFTHWDVYTPFPIHGMEEAMGVKRTILPVIVFVMGISAAGLGYLMQWWMSRDYPLPVQGKPYDAWEAYIPITFELGILISAFTALFGMLIMNDLPLWIHPLFNRERFLRVSDDRFVIAIESKDSRFDPEKTKAFLSGAGATHVEFVEQ